MAGVQCKFVAQFSNYVWSLGTGQCFENPATFHTQTLCTSANAADAPLLSKRVSTRSNFKYHLE